VNNMKLIQYVKEVRNLRNDSEAGNLARAIINYCVDKNQSLTQILDTFAKEKGFAAIDREAVFKEFIKAFDMSVASTEFNDIPIKQRKQIYEFDGNFDALLAVVEEVVQAVNQEPEAVGSPDITVTTVEAMALDHSVALSASSGIGSAEKMLEDVPVADRVALPDAGAEVPPSSMPSGGAASGSSSGMIVAAVFAPTTVVSEETERLAAAVIAHQTLLGRSTLYALLQQMKDGENDSHLCQVQIAMANLMLAARSDEDQQLALADFVAALSSCRSAQVEQINELFNRLSNLPTVCRRYKAKERSIAQIIFQSEKIGAKNSGAEQLEKISQRMMFALLSADFIAHAEMSLKEIAEIDGLATAAWIGSSEFAKLKLAFEKLLVECQKLTVERDKLPAAKAELLDALEAILTVAAAKEKDAKMRSELAASSSPSKF
jgi:hypothetical protein